VAFIKAFNPIHNNSTTFPGMTIFFIPGIRLGFIKFDRHTLIGIPEVE